jgi:hypothetical protein
MVFYSNSFSITTTNITTNITSNLTTNLTTNTTSRNPVLLLVSQVRQPLYWMVS